MTIGSASATSTCSKYPLPPPVEARHTTGAPTSQGIALSTSPTLLHSSATLGEMARLQSVPERRANNHSSLVTRHSSLVTRHSSLATRHAASTPFLPSRQFLSRRRDAVSLFAGLAGRRCWGRGAAGGHTGALPGRTRASR